MLHRNRPHAPAQMMRGGTLIEVLVSILVLSFGLLAIGGMMAYAIQLPKFAGNRAVASTLATELSERIRANAPAYAAGNYTAVYTTTFSVTASNTAVCTYPNCTGQQLAQQDLNDLQRYAQAQLPGGGLEIEAPDVTSGEGRLFVVWVEAASAGSLGGNTDICPSLSGLPSDSKPRCVMVKFRP